MEKQKPLASLYGDPPVRKKKKLSARVRANASSKEENPSIASLKWRHPPPPHRLPAYIAAVGGAAGCVEVDSGVPSSSKLVVSVEVDSGRAHCPQL
jgi:hypothetical protein